MIALIIAPAVAVTFGHLLNIISSMDLTCTEGVLQSCQVSDLDPRVFLIYPPTNISMIPSVNEV